MAIAPHTRATHINAFSGDNPHEICQQPNVVNIIRQQRIDELTQFSEVS